LRIKEQGKQLTLNEHDDDDDKKRISDGNIVAILQDLFAAPSLRIERFVCSVEDFVSHFFACHLLLTPSSVDLYI